MIEQLQRLSEIAPDVCKSVETPNGDYYQIGECLFFGSRWGLAAEHSTMQCTGRLALAWLADALEAAIAAQWDFEYRFFSSAGTTPDHHSVEILNGGKGKHIGDTKAAALLAALIKALEAETE